MTLTPRRLAVFTAAALLAAAGGGLLARADQASGRGAQLFRQCGACHSLEPGQTKAGPSLAGLFGRRAGSLPGYRYSSAMAGSDVIWNASTLDAFLKSPRGFMPGNGMAFAGIRNADDRHALIQWLEQATAPAAAEDGTGSGTSQPTTSQPTTNENDTTDFGTTGSGMMGGGMMNGGMGTGMMNGGTMNRGTGTGTKNGN